MTLLPEVEASLRDAVRRHHDERARPAAPPSEHVGSRRSRILPAVSISVGALALALVVTAFLVGHGATKRPTSPVRHDTASRVPRALLASFVSLRKPLTEDDALPSDIAKAFAHGHVTGVDPSLSRLLLTDSTQSIWLVPGRQTTCIVSRQPVFPSSPVEDIGATCSSDTAAEQRGLVYLTGNTIAGVLPDGSSSATFTFQDGSTAQLPANNQGAFAERLNPRPTSLSYTGPNGTEHTLTIPPAAIRGS